MQRHPEKRREKNRQTDRVKNLETKRCGERRKRAPESTPKKRGDRGTEKPRGVKNP